MAETIGTAYIQIEPSTDGISGSISGVLDGEASSAGTSAGSKFSSGFGSVVSGLAGTVAAVGSAATAAGTALVGTASATASAGDNIDKMSQKLGVSSSFYQEWDAVLQHSGTSMDSMKSTFKTLSNAVQDGSADQQTAFATLGLSMESLKGMSTEEVFTAVITKLQGMEEGTQRTAIATDLLGKGATELGALMNTSAEDTQAMIDTVNQLGGVMSEDAVKDSAAFEDSLQDLQTVFTGVKNSAMSELLPGMTEVMNGITALASGQEGAEEQISAGVQSMVTNITEALPTLVESFSTIVEAILPVAPQLITTLAEGIISSLPTLLPTLLEVVLEIGTALINYLPQIIEAGVQVIVQLALGIAQALPTLVPTIVEVVTTIVQYLIENISLLIDAAIQLITGLAEGLIEALPILIEKAPEIIVALVDGLIENLPKIIEAALQIIVALGEGLVEALPDIIQMGADIVEGIQEGIAKAWDGICNWFKEKIDALKDIAADVLDIGSPSKVFANEIGKWIPAGIAKGIDDNMGVLDDTMSSVSSGLVASASLDASNVTSQMYSQASTRTTSNDDIYSLLKTYLPLASQRDTVNVQLQGDANNLFRMTQSKASQYKTLTGHAAFA